MSNRRRPLCSDYSLIPLPVAVAVAATDAGMTPVWNHEPSMWLHVQLDAIKRRDAAGTLPTCPHATTGRASVALWTGKATCLTCAPSQRPHGDEDKTCDRCRSLCDGVIYPAIVAAGRFVVAMGLCPDCHRREMAA